MGTSSLVVTESFSAIDIDGTDYTKIANYTNLSQGNKINFLEIPLAFKVGISAQTQTCSRLGDAEIGKGQVNV